MKSVQLSIADELKMFAEERNSIVIEQKLINERIRGELRPQITKLKNLLDDYTIALGQYKAKEMIETFSDVLTSELNSVIEENSVGFNFDLKNAVKNVLFFAL